MTLDVFEPLTFHARRSGRCPCGRTTERAKTFHDAVNPLHVDPDTGRPKTRDQVLADLAAEAAQWVPGWSPSGICTACGEGRRPVVDVTHHTYRASGSTGRPKRQALTGNHSRGMNGSGYPQTRTSAAIAGYSCGCPEPSAPTTPALVLDPFGGTGTTALVARVLGRRGISVDMSSDYCRIAQWRTNDPAELARAAAAEKPPTVMRGQLALFGEEEAS